MNGPRDPNPQPPDTDQRVLVRDALDNARVLQGYTAYHANLAVEAIEAQTDTLNFLRSQVGIAHLINMAGDSATRTTPNPLDRNQDHKRPEILTAIVVGTPLHSPAFYWAPELCRMLGEVAVTCPPTTLQPSLVPTDRGFFFFALPLTTDPGEKLRAHAFGWMTTDWGLQLIEYSTTAHRFLIPSAICPWPWNSEWPDTNIDSSFTADGSFKVGTIRSSKEGWTDKARMMAKLLASGWLFLQQNIIVPHQERVDRPARRRYERVVSEPPVLQVIKLRRRIYENRPESDSTDLKHEIEWSCQWVVGAHWRQQFYPSDRSHRPLWIAPYTKGPADKPLRGAQRVFAVVR